MKAKALLLLALMAVPGMVTAQNSLTVTETTIPQNGGELKFNFTFAEENVYTSYQFKIVTPEGAVYDTDADGDVTCGLGACHTASHSATVHWNVSTRILGVGVASLSSALLKGTSGELISIPLLETEKAVGTVLTFTVQDITYIRQDGVKDKLDDLEVNITVGAPVEKRTLLDETSTAAPVAATGVDVRVKRSIKGGEWGTICLPFSMTEAQTKAAFGDDVQLGDFNDYDYDDAAQTISVKFTAATAIEANHPYIIKVGTDVTEFTVDGVDIDPEEEPIINRGTKRKPKEFIGCYEAGTLIDNGCLFLSGGKFWYSVGTTKIKAFRAYFNFNDLLADFEDNYAEARMQIVFGDGPSGISELVSGQAAEGEYYDLQGRRVLTPARGVYVKDGKKMVVK